MASSYASAAARANWITRFPGTSTPSIMNHQRKQHCYTGGGSYHREQLHTTFIVELSAGTAYNFNLAVRKLWNYTMRIYRGSSSTGDGSPDGYITVEGPLTHYPDNAA